MTAEGNSWHGQPTSATIRVPPLGTLWLRYRPEQPDGQQAAAAGSETEDAVAGTDVSTVTTPLAE